MTSTKTKWKQTPAQSRQYQYKTKYGLTTEDYETMLTEQDGKCFICFTDKPGGHRKNFCIDHDHETNVIRGLLCNRCNGILGWYEKNRARIELHMERAFR